jgi:hypothetical protein
VALLGIHLLGQVEDGGGPVLSHLGDQLGHGVCAIEVLATPVLGAVLAALPYFGALPAPPVGLVAPIDRPVASGTGPR